MYLKRYSEESWACGQLIPEVGSNSLEGWPWKVDLVYHFILGRLREPAGNGLMLEGTLPGNTTQTRKNPRQVLSGAY